LQETKFSLKTNFIRFSQLRSFIKLLRLFIKLFIFQDWFQPSASVETRLQYEP